MLAIRQIHESYHKIIKIESEFECFPLRNKIVFLIIFLAKIKWHLIGTMYPLDYNVADSFLFFEQAPQTL